MARATLPPCVDHSLLVQSSSLAEAIPVGSAAWHRWLADATSFTFRGTHGTFTAYKERRAPTREYWKAYRHRAGHLYRAYLGKSAELTLERLELVAASLAGTTTDALGPTRALRASAANKPLYPQPPAAAPPSSAAGPLHLLGTKLTPPVSRPNLVPRPQLAARLDAAIDQGQRLILIAAPAGFGKTTTLVEWLATRRAQPVALAWLALDDHDNDLAQFLAYVIAAIECQRPGIGAAAWALLRTRAAQPPAHAILTIMLNALDAATDQIILALDDYHTLALPAIHAAVAFLLEHMPPHMQLVITSRTDPPLPLARLRARGQLTELRAADLRFTLEEAHCLFAQADNLALPAELVMALEARTEGWVAGLQLAALSLQEQEATRQHTFIADFTGSHAYVFDYLADEVFQRLPEQVRAFLMQSALVARMCGPLCAALTLQNDAQLVLEHLEQQGLFLIRLDDMRVWYRYHHLFRDFLLQRLHHAVDAPTLALLHQRASAWFEQQGLIGEALEHALSAGEWEAALRCIAPLLAPERFYDYYLDWPRWLAALPDSVLQRDPELCLRLVWILIFTGHLEASARPLCLAEAVWQAAGNHARLGALLSYRALALGAKGALADAIDVAQQALDKLPVEAREPRAIATYVLGSADLDSGHAGAAAEQLTAAYTALYDVGETFLILGASTAVARAYELQGELQYAARIYHDAIRRIGGITHLQVPAAYIHLGMLYYEWNDLAAAEQLLREGITIARQIGRERYWPSADSALARVRWAYGDAAHASTLAEQSLAAARLTERPIRIAETEVQQARLWLAEGNLVAAMRWLATRALSADDDVPYARQVEYLMLVRIQLAQEQQVPGSVVLPSLLRLLGRLQQAAQADQRICDQVAILALTALVQALQPAPNQALTTLAVALTLAEPEGYLRTFVDEGPAMQQLIAAQRLELVARVSEHATEADTRLLAYSERLLQIFAQPVAALSELPTPPEQLSERERAVLQLLATGHSLHTIATELVISVHTARSHVKNIYAKLDAHNRVQALERARAAQLL